MLQDRGDVCSTLTVAAFKPATTIEYDLPAPVRLAIYDILRRKVIMLVDEEKETGRYKLRWGAARLAGGLYFYRLEAGSFSQAKN